MNNLRDIALAGKRALVRVDFNVPMDDAGLITEDSRIVGAIPTIEYIVTQGGKVILCSHMGKPKGQRQEKLSLKPTGEYLAKLIGKPVAFVSDCIGQEVAAKVAAMKDGDILLLENLRFHKEETDNDPAFSAQLAKLAEVYVDDAFAAAHRAHASVVGVAALLAEKAPGFLLQKEIDYFHKAMDAPERPLVALVGGAKVSSKLGALLNMLGKVDRMIIGGAMANTFLKSQGVEVGASKVEDDLLDAARDVLAKAAEKGVAVFLPVDFVAADAFAPDAVTKIVTTKDMPKNWMALDIGPASVLLFKEALQDAKTIVWNGPMGAFEMDAFARGTMALCQAVAASHALSITGGGDSNAAVKKAGEEKNISYMSTGGGAFLELMEGKTLPGLAALA
ncbi:MAG: phosphoglycerate kinase [Desulfobulbaceae bacterium]|jgi:phosphoglycerate kinase|nr:phosphoglycerate kinase [Desulfobulbaceae bacterium]